MDEEGHDPIADSVPFCAYTPQRHRIHELQVARVETKGEMHRPARGRHPVSAVAQMVLHVTASLMKRIDKILEFMEDLPWSLPENIRQHAEAASMRHRQHDLLHPCLAGPLAS